MRSGTLLAVALLAAAPLVGRAVDAPHEDGLYCSNCHVGHNAAGAGLTNVAGNYNLCESCHGTVTSPTFGFPWPASHQAVPGVSGRSHRWDADASSLGAIPPSAASSDPAEAEMGKRLDAGKLMCSTCHDQHQADVLPVTGRGRQHVSTITRAASGTGSVTLVGPVGASATAKAYLLDVVAAGSESTATFRVSNDNGASWFGCTAPTVYSYVAYVASPSNACRAGPSVALNDGGNVTVAFGAGTYLAGDRWKFHVSYPFLRVDNTDARMCTTCHRDRNMTSENVQGAGVHAGMGGAIVPGTTVFHHPVGPGAVPGGAILDASGDPQGTGDGIAGNDLVLGTSGGVTCLTCHRVHNAYSNSLSADP